MTPPHLYSKSTYCERVFTNPTCVSVMLQAIPNMERTRARMRWQFFLDVTRIFVVWEFSRVFQEWLFCEVKIKWTRQTKQSIKFVGWLLWTIKSTVQYHHYINFQSATGGRPVPSPKYCSNNKQVKIVKLLEFHIFLYNLLHSWGVPTSNPH